MSVLLAEVVFSSCSRLILFSCSEVVNESSDVSIASRALPSPSLFYFVAKPGIESTKNLVIDLCIDTASSPAASFSTIDFAI